MECNFFHSRLIRFQTKEKKGKTIELENSSLTHISFEIFSETNV